MIDNYPEDEELEAIRAAKPSDVLGLARPLWIYPDYWRDGPAPRGEVGVWHTVSTGGWSGHEDVIGAMMDNKLFWAMHWMSSKRGGHYQFREDREETSNG